ncbi:hypothetical protein OKW30_003931 [Paraburkholderia sp. Clong3]|nr:hypothetical protein [Paraburkholderia sp. CI2]
MQTFDHGFVTGRAGPFEPPGDEYGAKKRAAPAYFTPTPRNCVGPNGSILKPVTFLLIG